MLGSPVAEKRKRRWRGETWRSERQRSCDVHVGAMRGENEEAGEMVVKEGKEEGKEERYMCGVKNTTHFHTPLT